MAWILYREYGREEYDDLQWEEMLRRYPMLEAAGGIVRNPRGEVLMILKRGRWDLPKGKQEDWETLEACALREVQEECGVEGLRIVAYRDSTYHIYEEQDGQTYIKHTAWYEMTCEDCSTPCPQVQEDITQATWANEEQLKDYLQNAYPSIRDILLAWMQNR